MFFFFEKKYKCLNLTLLEKSTMFLAGWFLSPQASLKSTLEASLCSVVKIWYKK